jgi:steroid delta-isomerase-like uncharacterized protein
VSTAEQQASNPVTELARTYFDATARRDLDAMEACWAAGGIEHIAPVGDLRVPDEYRAYFKEIFDSFPDLRYEVLQMLTEGNKVAVHWRMSGTFTGAPYQGLQPNGRSGDIKGIDIVEFADGKIVRNDVYFDSATLMRKLGVLPETGSAAERATKAVFNVRTKIGKALEARRQRGAG